MNSLAQTVSGGQWYARGFVLGPAYLVVGKVLRYCHFGTCGPFAERRESGILSTVARSGSSPTADVYLAPAMTGQVALSLEAWK